MSGGAFDYRDGWLNVIADELDRRGPRYTKLAARLRQDAEVLREVDLVLSGDGGRDDDLPALASIGCAP